MQAGRQARAAPVAAKLAGNDTDARDTAMIQRLKFQSTALACAMAWAVMGAAGAQTPVPETPTGASATAALPGADRYRVLVHRHPQCGCCMKWVGHLRQARFQVDVEEHASMDVVKAEMGVPEGKRSCHTAKVGDYFVEGHVPAKDILRLLAEAPKARGLTVPGMPAGSPGMEVPDGTVQAYSVELVKADGSTSEFARHGE